MTEPSNFGLNPVQTLAHVADTTPAPSHGPYWQHWNERIWASPASLRPRLDSEDVGEPGVTHIVESTHGVRIGAALIEPAGPIRGVVMELHGYAAGASLDEPSPWPEHGMAVMRLRVRGYPGSHLDTGDLASSPEGWITHNIEDPDAWSLSGGVADVVMAFRALRDHYGSAMPISIRGESFGGGLAVIAASQITGRDEIHRMAIGLPTFGDWIWRAANPAFAGAGKQIKEHVARHPDRRDTIHENLRLFDAAIHARRVRCPVLCKLALHDDVVPAPTAAAVYNALASDPGRKWRFVTRYGHFDGGVTDLRRHALFERIALDFLDPANEFPILERRWNLALGNE